MARMRICNRKIAARIVGNKIHINTLYANGLTPEGIKALREIRADIERDIDTLAKHGYNERGEKVL
jgi:hypothetical protein